VAGDSEFFQQLARIVGEGNVAADEAVRTRLSRTTAPNGTIPLGVVYPTTREHVQQIVLAATRFSIPVFPISRGKNWGYGDACAPHDDALIIDLSRMNRIVEINPELAYAVIEPGVSQGQLLDHIERQGLPLMFDATGAGPDASIVGNTIERGSGHTPYGDHFATSCNYEVVLPDGSLLQTGFGAYANARAQHVYKWGIGPSLDGLFTQSNLGIVTRMTIWLMPKPEVFAMFIIALRARESVGPFFDAIRKLRMAGTVRSTVHCFNQGRLLAAATRFPWERASGRQALEVEHAALYQELCRKYALPQWGATGSLTGTRSEVKGAARAVRAALRNLRDVERLVVLSDRTLLRAQQVAQRLRPILPNLSLLKRIDTLRLGMDLLKGRPSYETLKGAHWRARGSPGTDGDPVATLSGLAWICPILPMTAAAIQEVSSVGEATFHGYGFEYQATITAINERALIAVLSISFDRSNPEECERARDCQALLLERLLERGYVPYRGPASVVQAVWRRAPDYWPFLSSIKQSWDPTGVLAPDRYLPG
jgi:4-cresol dehydrogenase (hydroxylating) flavoprotein subunit